ncbi:MAG TPA: hypothetical protein VH595_24070 [Verrucomicrobiae bacterium]|jgi:hypothetical protein|nr:hypothetical protein [Verrucomicrobiae bacterium]
MSKAEILAELPKLTKKDRYEIRVKLAEMDSGGWLDVDDPLDDSEKATLEARLVLYEKNPDAGNSWKNVEACVRASLKK